MANKKEKLIKEEKIIRIIKRLRRKAYFKSRWIYGPPTVRLVDVLLYVKKKFKLKSFTPQLQMIVAAWKWTRDDLRRQPEYCIYLVYYFVFVPCIKQKKDDNIKSS